VVAKKSKQKNVSKTQARVSVKQAPQSFARLVEEREKSFPSHLKINLFKGQPKMLRADEVYNSCELTDSHVKDFAAKEPNYEIVSQERAVRAITVGLGIQKPGYNIYVAGVQGTGKTSVIRTFLKKTAKSQPTPGDWIYVYNFKSPEMPRAIAMKTGAAKKFKKDMDEFVEVLADELPAALQSEEYENKVNATVNASNDKKTKLFNELEKSARGMNFGVKSTRMGIVTVPIIDGKPLSEKEYSELTEHQKEEIETARNNLEPEVLDFARRVRGIEAETRILLEELRSEVGNFVLKENLDPLLKMYVDNKEITEYLNEIKENILENLVEFLKKNEGEGEDEEGEEPEAMRPRKADPYVQYRVNVFVDNTESKGAPIIVESNPTYYNLFGKIEKNIEYGIYTTDFKMIKAGALARANGGYLVLNAIDIFRNPQVWETLKRVIKNQKLFIEDLGEQYSLLPTSGLRPEPIALNVKIIIIGSDWIYRTLYQVDEDFNKIFKIKADFDVQMTRNTKHIDDYIRFITTRSKVENLLPFDASAIATIVEHSSRITDDQQKLSTRFSLIKDLTIESNFMAKERGAGRISADDVEKAIDEHYVRSNLVEDHISESLESGDILLSTNSRRVGEINGLVVYDLGDISFGKPARITCRSFKGKPGIVNIEREAQLSGKLHNKGVSIMASWLNATFARKAPIQFSGAICFEQNYGGVDGDSATLAEILLISSTAGNIPIDQGIAVTGSVNQFGEVQPIGGVNEKVEGFFKTCNKRGLTGRQGCIIPVQNVKNLMLNRKTREAIAEGKFHIWPVSKVEEAFEVITGFEAGTWDEKTKKWTAGSAFERIDHALHPKGDGKKEDGKKKLAAKTAKKPQTRKTVAKSPKANKKSVKKTTNKKKR
jgi:predicted ATP-dependent protease